MKKLYQETFDGVRASGRLREEVMDMTGLERTRRRRAVPKAALIAAVLAAVLAGTAVAAELLGLTVSFVTSSGWNEDGRLDPGYEILVDRQLIPADCLTEELLDLAAAAGDGMRYFPCSSRREAEELWGLELLENPLLKIPKTSTVLTDGETCIGQGLLSMSCREGALMWSTLEVQYEIPGPVQRPINVTMTASIVTENATDTDYESARNAGCYFNAEPEDTTQSCEEYVTPGGLEAVLITSHILPRAAEEPVEEREYAKEFRAVSAFFVRDHVLYELAVYDWIFEDGEDAQFRYREEDVLSTLKQILDAYE